MTQARMQKVRKKKKKKVRKVPRREEMRQKVKIQ